MKKQSITLSQASEAFIRSKTADDKSEHTLRNYRTSFAKLRAFIPGDPPLKSTTEDQLIDFFAWLRTDYISASAGVASRPPIKLSPKSILNVHTDLSSLWTWAVKESYVPGSIVRKIEPPDPKPPVVEPFTLQECEAMLAACKLTQAWKNRAETRSSRATADRDESILRLLMDTGMRASELCGIKIEDILQTHEERSVHGSLRQYRYLPGRRRFFLVIS